MKTLATYRVSLILDDEDSEIKAEYERLVSEGKTVKEIDEELSNVLFEGVKEMIEEESEDGLIFIVEKIEDLPF